MRFGGVLIGVLLVLQAAHQPPAGAGDLGGVQAQVLGLGHLDGHRHKARPGTGSSRRAGRRCPGRPASWPRPGRRSAAARCGPGTRDARSFTSSRKSTRPSAVKKKMILLPSKLHCHVAPASSPACARRSSSRRCRRPPSPGCGCSSAVRRSFSVAMRTTGAQGLDHAASSTSWLPSVQLGILQALGRLHDHVLPRLHLQRRWGQNNSSCIRRESGR